MKRRLLLVAALIGLIGCGSPKPEETKEETTVVAEPTGPQVMGQEVSYSADGIEMKGYMAYDANKEGKRPGILVVHEWWGHNEYVRKRADMLAEMGYVAIAVDMYGDGKQAGHPEDAGKFATAVFQNFEGATARFSKAIEILKANPQVDADKIAAIGYCFGGGVVLNMARQGMDLDGVVSFHGSLNAVTPINDVKAKILVCNGEADPFVKAEQIEAFKKEMDDAKVSYQFINYKDAVHAFTNPDATAMGEKFSLPLAYQEAADKESWEAMKTFFAQIF